MSYFHPMVVHFPIALIFVTFALDLLGKIRKNEKLLYAGTVVSIFATAGAVAALITGLIAEDTGWQPAAVVGMMETHELMGYVTMGIVAVMLIVRLALRDKLDTSIGWVIVAIGALAIVSVSYGGYLGGEMVYTHGTGVVAVEECQKEKNGIEDKFKAMEREDKQPAEEYDDKN